MRTTFLAITASVLVSTAAVAEPTLEDSVKASLLRQANLSYAELLADGVAAGRLYNREAAASGAKRHAEEFLARQYVRLPQTSSAE